MKEWLQQKLVGDGPLHDALRDLIWMMPSWSPYVVLALAVLWWLCLWLGRRGKDARHRGKRSPKHLGTMA